MSEITSIMGQQAVTAILVQLCCIAFTWWALQAIDITKVMKKNKIAQIRAIYIILTIVLGSALGNFFMQYLEYSRSILYLF